MTISKGQKGQFRRIDLEKHLLCLLKRAVKNGTKEARLILQSEISIFVEKNGPITAHFQSKKVGTLNCKRFPAGVAFQRVCKIIKIVGKVFVCKRLLSNLWKDAS